MIFTPFIHQVLGIVEPGKRKTPCSCYTNATENYILLRKVRYIRLQQILNVVHSLLSQDFPCKNTFSLGSCLKENLIQYV